MTGAGWAQIVLYFAILIALVKPLGGYMARVYEGEPVLLEKVFGSLERFIYRLSGVKRDDDQTWKAYAIGMLIFNVAGLLVVYLLQRLQAALPLNPQGLAAVTPDSSWNTAVSF